MSFDIRPVRRDQLDEWLRLREAIYTGIDDEFHDQEMKLFLGDDTKECFLAMTEAGDVCGMVEVSLRNIVDGCLTSPVAYIEGIDVDPEFRGTGIARQLLVRAEHWCRSKGCQEIGTDAELANTDVQRIHEKMGFKETYRIVGFEKTCKRWASFPVQLFLYQKQQHDDRRLCLHTVFQIWRRVNPCSRYSFNCVVAERQRGFTLNEM